MSKFSEAPAHITTSYLILSSICFTHDDNYVYLFGCYGNLVNGDINSIEIETDFETLNTLLYEIDEYADEAIEALANKISNPTTETETIYFIEQGGLHFMDHIFVFSLIRYEDEDDDEELTYHLNGFMKRKEMLPDFIEFSLPTNQRQLVKYYNEILAVHYQFYLNFRKITTKEIALISSGLYNQLLFTLAKAQFNLLKESRH
jgi:hypothetical protein